MRVTKVAASERPEESARRALARRIRLAKGRRSKPTRRVLPSEAVFAVLLEEVPRG